MTSNLKKLLPIFHQQYRHMRVFLAIFLFIVAGCDQRQPPELHVGPSVLGLDVVAPGGWSTRHQVAIVIQGVTHNLPIRIENTRGVSWSHHDGPILIHIAGEACPIRVQPDDPVIIAGASGVLDDLVVTAVPDGAVISPRNYLVIAPRSGERPDIDWDVVKQRIASAPMISVGQPDSIAQGR